MTATNVRASVVETVAAADNRFVETLRRLGIDVRDLGAQRVFLARGPISLTDDTRRTLYFPIDAVVASWIERPATAGADPELACASFYGRFGVVGYERMLGWDELPARTNVLCAGRAWRVAEESAGLDALPAARPLHRMIGRFACALLAVAALRQTCNLRHTVRERIARWLVSLSEETNKTAIPLTHEALAGISAVRRPTVSLALSSLQREGVVRLAHGCIDIVDRGLLLSAACACATAIRNTFARVTEVELARR